jgi:hypothetical protein
MCVGMYMSVCVYRCIYVRMYIGSPTLFEAKEAYSYGYEWGPKGSPVYVCIYVCIYTVYLMYIYVLWHAFVISIYSRNTEGRTDVHVYRACVIRWVRARGRARISCMSNCILTGVHLYRACGMRWVRARECPRVTHTTNEAASRERLC